MTDKEILSEYLPDNAVDEVLRWMKEKKIHLKIARNRKTKLGDYRAPVGYPNHRISINNGLNEYAFLITFIHELAHLLVFEKHQNKVAPHGMEWKATYRDLILSFVNLDAFPDDIKEALLKSVQNGSNGKATAKASSVSDHHLSRVLHQYDEKDDSFLRLEELPIGQQFFIDNGLVYEKGEKLRTRYKCLNLKNKKLYMFHPLTPVYPVD